MGDSSNDTDLAAIITLKPPLSLPGASSASTGPGDQE